MDARRKSVLPDARFCKVMQPAAIQADVFESDVGAQVLRIVSVDFGGRHAGRGNGNVSEGDVANPAAPRAVFGVFQISSFLKMFVYGSIVNPFGNRMTLPPINS